MFTHCLHGLICNESVCARQLFQWLREKSLNPSFYMLPIWYPKDRARVASGDQTGGKAGAALMWRHEPTRARILDHTPELRDLAPFRPDPDQARRLLLAGPAPKAPPSLGTPLKGKWHWAMGFGLRSRIRGARPGTFQRQLVPLPLASAMLDLSRDGSRAKGKGIWQCDGYTTAFELAAIPDSQIGRESRTFCEHTELLK